MGKETWPVTTQTLTMETFATMVKGYKWLAFAVKHHISDVWRVLVSHLGKDMQRHIPNLIRHRR